MNQKKPQDINELERLAEKYIGVGHGTLEGRCVFCTDMTFDATVNPVAYEGGEAVFVDTESGTWNMDPKALRVAFKRYQDVRLAVVAHLYGTPGKMEEIRALCRQHQALLIEDAGDLSGKTDRRLWRLFRYQF